MKNLLVSLLVLGMVSCAAVPIAQELLSVYSVESTVNGKTTAANSKFFAVEAGHAISVRIHGPEVYGGAVTVLKEWTFTANTERKVWQLILPTQKGEKPKFVEATWEQARVSMPYLPE